MDNDNKALAKVANLLQANKILVGLLYVSNAFII